MKTQSDEKQLRHGRIYYLKWIWNEYRNHKTMILFLLALTVLSAFTAVLFPMVFKYIIDSLVEGLKQFQTGQITIDAAKSERNKMLLTMGLGPIFGGLYPFFRAKMNIFFSRCISVKNSSLKFSQKVINSF